MFHIIKNAEKKAWHTYYNLPQWQWKKIKEAKESEIKRVSGAIKKFIKKY